MRKIKLLAVFGIVCIGLGVLFSCNANIKTSGASVSKVEYEIEKLASVAELDALATRGDDNIVDWQLSREFAELWLESGIAEGEYPADSELWQIPIAIYSNQGNIKFYEFRIISDNKTVGAIVGAATKDYGCPIVYEGLKDGYANEITELYNSGKLSADQLLRIVDDGYPKVVAGVVNETRGTADVFSGYLDLITGKEISKDDIKQLLDYYSVKANDPELVADAIDEKVLAAIEDYENNGKAFWEMAVANKGRIADFAVRGTAKNTPRTVEDRMKEYWKWNMNKFGRSYNQIYNYGGACGAVAEGFVLDYLYANGLIGSEWNNLSQLEKEDVLYDKLGIFPVFGDKDIGEATWPWNLGNAIRAYGDYKESYTLSPVPESAIDNGLPGISLRIFNIDGGGFNHYRPVIAYKKPGWWIFKWYEMKVLDLVDCTTSKEKRNGSWETYHPINHFMMYNIVKK